ncbi:hypothetical protein CAPTEDRAFT_228466 [Capitella teleta]|uniref:ELMO domain-containing protein n=1 Tax=Capitella teleta TaxID=283909 RepID=R7V3X7_CAPTE|nr:hypothetical protein CAPTEDRAFT_228466 [Capitella teleta]|eukprot:ELU11056.1 hypothetical protein CAPTEDRAFT_228466 [Capitella teleta]
MNVNSLKMYPTTSENIKRVAVTREGQHPHLLLLDQSKPLAAIISDLCSGWTLQNADDYALRAVEPSKFFITERNRVELQNGNILELCNSPALTAQAIYDEINSSHNLEDKISSLRLLSEYSGDQTFAQEFINKKGHLSLISMIEGKTYSGEALAHTLKAFVELMDHGIVSWDIVEPRFIQTVANSLSQSKKSTTTDATTLQSALEILESIVLNSSEKYSLVEQEVTPVNLVHHLQSSNTDIQKSAMALINALFLKAESARRKKIAENMQSKNIRNIILNNVMRPGASSSNPEMAHQLYVLQSLLLGQLEEKQNRAADLNDQQCMKDITDLRRIAFDSDGDMSPSPSKRHGHQKDYKKLGFQNLANPIEDFTTVPPGSLALDCMIYFAKMHGENYTKVVLENSCRADDHDLPFARASIELCNVLCDILKIGEPPSEEGQTYYPMFFTQERPFEEFYSNTIPTFNKTWREMRATAADFSKVLSVVKEQITRSLSDLPASFETFRNKLGKLTYSEITKIWELERYHHEESESQAKPIVELREEIRPEILELIKQQRLNFLVEGSLFNKKVGRSNNNKDHFWFCRLSPNHKVFYYGDVENENTSPSIEQLNNKLPVLDLREILTGQNCPHMSTSAQRKKAATQVSLAFSLKCEADNDCVNFIAPDEKTFQMWTDGINALLGNPMTSDLTTQEMDILLSMEIKLRILDIEGVNVPEDAPPIPPPPPNYDFAYRNI